MTRTIAQLEAELARLRQRKDSLTLGFKETFDKAGVGMAHVGLDGRFIDVNECFCAMLGRSQQELARLTFRDVTFADDVGTNVELFEQLRRREISGYRMEKRYVRANGTYFWGDLTVAAHRDETGEPIRLISVVVDISKKKQDEERFAFIMGELAHRTKNMAAVLQGIVGQTSARATTVDEFRDQVLHRLAGIAASQESIARQEGGGAGLRDLVERQLEVFLAPGDRRIVVVSGPDVTLNPDATRAIGMALHELATNALKYGCLLAAPGLLTISWETDAAGRFRMSWVERGGPPVQPPTRSGFGRRVIERMVAASTNGRVELTFEPAGVEWLLEADSADVFERT